MKSIYFLLLSVMLLCLASNCNTTKPTSENNNSDTPVLVDKQTTSKPNTSSQFEKGKIHFKLKPVSKTNLPDFDASKPLLGAYPILNNLIKEYKIKKIYRTHPNMNTENMARMYTIEFIENNDIDALIAALKRLEEIEYAEKIAMNKKN